MKIGELAKLTDCAVETIRYYERENLLPEPARSDGNYRVYTQAHAERLTFIRNCRTLDMTLEEIRSLLAFRDSPQDQCESVNALIDEHIHHVKARIDGFAGLADTTARPAPTLWRRAGCRSMRDFAAVGSEWRGCGDGG